MVTVAEDDLNSKHNKASLTKIDLIPLMLYPDVELVNSWAGINQNMPCFLLAPEVSKVFLL